VSHQPERKEKDCLNCGTQVAGRYCQSCGQENIVTHQGFWSLTKHFIYDIFHFDGKFFDTLFYLLFKPGKVPKEYVMGKRLHYLDPIRMYLFTSALFFLVLFSVTSMQSVFQDDTVLSQRQRFSMAARMTAENGIRDSVSAKKLNLLLDTTKVISLEPVPVNAKSDSSLLLQWNGQTYLMKPEKDELADTSWIDRQIIAKLKERRKQGEDNQELMAALGNEFLHRLPYLLFVSLPFFALILKLLYIRRKQFYYSDHAVFTLYHYIFSFILFLLVLGLNGLKSATGWEVFKFFSGLMKWIWLLYLLLGLKRFYGQGWGKTLLKFLVLLVLGLFLLVLIFAIFGLFSLFF
jgi:hypothetical protein